MPNFFERYLTTKKYFMKALGLKISSQTKEMKYMDEKRLFNSLLTICILMIQAAKIKK